MHGAQAENTGGLDSFSRLAVAMNDTLIVPTSVLRDDRMQRHGHRTDVRAAASDRAVLTVAVIVAAQVANHHERARCVLRGMHDRSGSLSRSRCNRRVHALAPWLARALDLRGAGFALATVAFTLDSLPVPVCKRIRAPRSTKVRGAAFYGYGAAKEERCFGWRLHRVGTGAGVPVGFALLPARRHDLNPVYDMAQCLPTGATRYRDKAYNRSDDEAWLEGEWGGRLVPSPLDERAATEGQYATLRGAAPPPPLGRPE